MLSTSTQKAPNKWWLNFLEFGLAASNRTSIFRSLYYLFQPYFPHVLRSLEVSHDAGSVIPCQHLLSSPGILPMFAKELS
jgi:hypothetical protein